MNRLTYPLRAIAALVAVMITQLLGAAAWAQQSGQVPGQALGNASDADLWRAIRRGAGNLIQAEGSTWRALHNGPLSTYGIWVMAGMVFLLALFFLLRGRIKIEHGWAGRTIERFSFIERFGHWLTAGSFIVLAITGLNILYGKYFLLPVIGKSAFATITAAGKFAHNWIAFAFMAGLVMIFFMWVMHNIPNRLDIKWFLQAGGLFSKNLHPPAKKFNAGQKVIFWVTILGGLSLSLSGWTLLDPFTTSMFADTFALLNKVGFALPTDLTPMQEQQYAQLWHAAVSMVMIAIIL
ncbi:MAG: cytochrome b/b6 domain-containing protein, partial [Alphaproteobacteria bacterium]|nr:cytochrome b/b6 domain-containing protein [Alphaproteobacteria bacterium]